MESKSSGKTLPSGQSSCAKYWTMSHDCEKREQVGDTFSNSMNFLPPTMSGHGPKILVN